MSNINDMTNAEVDAAIARILAERLGFRIGRYNDEFCPNGYWIEIDTLLDRPDRRLAFSSYTTDPTLTGFMLFGDEKRGVPGLWGFIEFGNIKALLLPVLKCSDFAGGSMLIYGQGDTDEQRMCSAMARAFLMLLLERSD